MSSRKRGSGALFSVLLALAWAVPLFGAGDVRLLDAVKRRDNKAFTALLAQKADVNATQPDGASALAWAAYLDERSMAESLLTHGANVNTADEYGETPLTLACGTGDAPLALKLIAAGADVNAARWNGETALMIAANAGSADIVKALLDKGAKIDAAEKYKGQNALMWASAEGHADVIKLLIDRGADVKTASKAGFTPLVFAVVKNDGKSVDALLAAGSDPDYKLSDGSVVLSLAAADKSFAAAVALVNSGAAPNVADRQGITPLHVAAQLGSLELVKALIAKGADVNAKSIKTAAGGGRGGGGGGGFAPPAGEQTPLMFAAKGNHEDIMRALIAAGADPKLKAQDGSTLLMSAVASGHIGPVKYAYEFDQDTKVVTDRGMTLMHQAVSGTLGPATQLEICAMIQFIADKGAPLDERDARGRTPIDVANVLPIDKAVDLMTDLIIKSGAKPKSPNKR